MPGSSQDTTILPEFFTAPIRMDFDLRGELGRCPQCGEAASAICFEAMPGEMV